MQTIDGELQSLWMANSYSHGYKNLSVRKKDCANFVLTWTTSEVQVTDNSNTVLDGQAPQVTD